MAARLSGVRVDNSEGGTSTSISQNKVQYPFYALLVSGGHTMVLLCEGLGEYKFLGGTLGTGAVDIIVGLVCAVDIIVGLVCNLICIYVCIYVYAVCKYECMLYMLYQS